MRKHRHHLQRGRVFTPVCAAWTDVASVLVFSAVPFVAVQALADSDAGKQLQRDLEARKPQLEAQQAEQEAARAAARAARYCHALHDSEQPW